MISSWIAGGNPTFFPLLAEFVGCGLLVLFLAMRLSHWADVLEKDSSVSAMWIGGIFLAIVTSLPEAVATVGSAIIPDAIELGVANLFGSNVFNLLILVLLDAMYIKGPLFAVVDKSLTRAAAGGALIMVLVGAAIVVSQRVVGGEWGGRVGVLFSLLVAAAYLVLSRTKVTKVSPRPDEPSGTDQALRTERTSLVRIVVSLCLYAALLVIAATFLLRVCDWMAVVPVPLGTGELVLGRTVTGTFLLSIGTSLPEVFVCVAALRLGQRDMAVANLLGSNMVNMFFLPLMHAVSRSGAFYTNIDIRSIGVLLCTALLMTATFSVGLYRHPRKSTSRLGWDSLCMLGIYILGALLVLKTGLSR